MIIRNDNIIIRALKKAKDSTCNHKISALGIDYKGEIIGVCRNIRSRQPNPKGHAEANLIKRYKDNIKIIFICRVNKTGKMLPIHPCKKCSELAEKYNIKIIPLLDIL